MSLSCQIVEVAESVCVGLMGFDSGCLKLLCVVELEERNKVWVSRTKDIQTRLAPFLATRKGSLNYSKFDFMV